MKKLFSFVFLISTLASCGQKVNDEFPNKIQTSKTDKHIRVKGTKVFGIMPKEYKYIKELARYQKNDNLYIQVIESNASSFLEAKPNFTKQSIEAQGATVDVLNNIKINDFDAIYGEGPSKYEGETKLMLIFGDESFVVMIAGVCKKADTKGKRELQEIFKSFYYDKLLQIDPLELANFEFDLSITNFKYSMTASNFFMYSENGKSDAQKTISNSIQIGAMPKMTDEKAVSFSNDLLWRYEKGGITLDSKEINKTKINNYTAFVLQTKTKLEYKDGILYQVLLLGENSSVLFMGSSFNDLDNYLLKYKKTVETIKIK